MLRTVIAEAATAELERQGIVLLDADALVTEILEAMERDPGHDATEGIVQPCEDRTRVVEVYQRIIRNARNAAY